jgi:hypothetical protein
MYKSDNFMEDQMTKYEMRLDAAKEWDSTLDHFSKLFAQRKAYGNNCAANSGFESTTTMFNVPSNRTFVTSKSNGDFTARDLYIESLEELLALARDYMTNAPTMAPASTPVTNPLTTLRLEMDAQLKQFKLLIKLNLDLVTAFVKANASPNPSSGATPKPRRTGCKRLRAHLKECSNCKNMCTHKPDDCHPLAANADKGPTNYRAPLST